MSRQAGLTALKKNRDVVKQALEAAIERCTHILATPVDEYDQPRNTDLRKAKRLLKQNRTSYESLGLLVLGVIEKAFQEAGKSEEEISASLDTEQSAYFSALSKADNVLWELEALEDDFSEILKSQEVAKLKEHLLCSAPQDEDAPAGSPKFQTGES